MRNIVVAIALLLLFSQSSHSDGIFNGGNSSGGSGTPGGTNGQIQFNNSGAFGGLTPAISTGCQATGGTIGDSLVGTISTQVTPTTLSGSNPAITTGYCGGLENLSNAGAQTPTIAEAGSAGFPAGWYTDLCNIGAGAQTLTPGAGTVGGAATKVIAAGSATSPTCLRLVSDGVSNYDIVFPPGGSSGITALTGDVTASGSGSVAATVATIAGVAVGTPTGTGNVVFSASPTLTGTVGAAAITATGVLTDSLSPTTSQSSLLLSGAPQTGGNATTNFPLLYLNDGTGPSTFSTAGTEFGVNAPSGFTGNFLDFHINGGASILSLGPTGIITTTGNQFVSSNNFSLLTSNSASMTVKTGNVSSPSTAAGNVIITGGNASGTGGTSNGASIVLTPGSSTNGTAGQVTLPAITSDATLTDTTVCQDTTLHALRAGSGTAGICLGNVSSIRFKHEWQNIIDGLAIMNGLDPSTYRYNEGIADGGTQLRVGFSAERYADILPQFTRYDSEGRPNGLDMLAAFPYAVRAIQQLDEMKADKKDVATLKEMVEKQQSEIEDLKRRVH